ncbi:MAG: hypothetical protein R2758_02750 [Bacteroidales bacterium]
MRKKDAPARLTWGDYSLGTPVKARKADKVIYSKENFMTFPDYMLTDLSFKRLKSGHGCQTRNRRITWGTAEIVKWISLDGREIEAMLYKPENFDPAKKYPMIVNFYEKSSTELNRHRIPEPGRSTIDYHYYTSHGYLISSTPMSIILTAIRARGIQLCDAGHNVTYWEGIC